MTRTVPAKFRNVERDFGRAVGFDAYDAGIERERRLRRRVPAAPPPCVAAGADRAARALHAVDQLTIEVADLGTEPALAEIDSRRAPAACSW